LLSSPLLANAFEAELAGTGEEGGAVANQSLFFRIDVVVDCIMKHPDLSSKPQISNYHRQGVNVMIR